MVSKYFEIKNQHGINNYFTVFQIYIIIYRKMCFTTYISIISFLSLRGTFALHYILN